MAVTLEDSLHAAGPGRQRLAHRHVELVVALLGRQVLDEENKQREQSQDPVRDDVTDHGKQVTFKSNPIIL